MRPKMEQTKLILPKNSNEIVVSQKWFLDGAEYYRNGDYSRPVDATFKALINGENAFREVHHAIERAEHSIDIAIWGFQPSMFFQRSSEGYAERIGSLLIRKAQAGVKIRLLVWSMWLNTQTFVHENANLGGKSGVAYGAVPDVTKEQEDYDRYWYWAMEGKLHRIVDGYKLGYIDPYLKNDPQFLSYARNFTKSRHHLVHHIENKYIQLVEFSRSVERNNIQYKNRRITFFNDTFDNRKYFDKNLPWVAELALATMSSHHQKTVLIDYENPEKALGFVMEHNMIDNYWDKNNHHYGDIKQPYQGKNVNTPLQDVSSLVTGEVLWDINYNFCQSWDKNGLFENRGNYDSSENLTQKRQHLTREMFKPNENLGQRVTAQILRTYDNPRVTDIQKIYLQNIKKTVSYIYTENQYFRYPPLVEEFLNHWETLRTAGRTDPIYWFAITNSSDDGIGAGTYTTNQMFKLLGRQDVMPNVVRQIQIEELEQKLAFYSATLTQPNLSNPEKIEELRKEKAELEKQIEESKQKAQKGIENEDPNLLKKIGAKLDQIPGIKSHICTLTSENSWNEVYVHSKVTIIDDVFSIISSANLNTRSMEKDTELGIAIEDGKVATELRKTLWALHTNQDVEANPDDLYNYKNTVKAFKEWQQLIEQNQKAKQNGKNVPIQPLRQFFRVDPKVSRID